MVKLAPIVGLRGGTVRIGNPGRMFRKYSRKAVAAKPASRARLGSKTLTQPRRRRQPLDNKTIQNAGGIVTQSYFKAYNRPNVSAFIRKHASSPNYIVTNSPSSFSALSGFQGFAFFGLSSRNDMSSILSAMPTQAPSGNATRRFLLERVQSNIVYTNASSASCTLDLYDIAVKQDNDLTATGAWTNGIAMETTVTATPVNILGIKPWQSQQFKEFFKVVRTTHVNLAAGASHRHNISLAPNALLKEQRVVENLNYRGLTYFTLAVVKGVPVCDDNDAPRLVSTAPITIDVVREQNVKYRWVTDTDTDLYITNNMVTLLQPEAMNVFQGQATAVTKAE